MATTTAALTEMGSELQAVLQEASKAQEYEDDGDIIMALESYYRAACQLSYFVDCSVEKGTAMADLCHGLVQSYEQRMAVGTHVAVTSASSNSKMPPTSDHRSPNTCTCRCLLPTGTAQEAGRQRPTVGAA